jgi:hypothetical protein
MKEGRKEGRKEEGKEEGCGEVHGVEASIDVTAESPELKNCHLGLSCVALSWKCVEV